MTNYEISGLILPSLEVASKVMTSFLDEAAVASDGFCLEAHFADLESLRALASHVHSSRFACYCWKEIGHPEDFRRSEMTALASARLNFGQRSVEINSMHALPTYDWDGHPIETVKLVYSERQGDLRSTEQQFLDENTISKMRNISRVSIGEELVPQITRGGAGATTEHYFHLQLPMEKAGVFLENTWRQFDLGSGIGSFEFLGDIGTIENLVRNKTYKTDCFPSNTWSLNSGAGKTPFALSRYSFLYPVPNMAREQLLPLSSLVDKLGEKLARCSIIQKYVAWKLDNGSFSPRTQDNYVLLSRQKVGWLMFVGFDQYADGDPPARRFKSAIAPILEKMGATLKRVPYYK